MNHKTIIKTYRKKDIYWKKLQSLTHNLPLNWQILEIKLYKTTEVNRGMAYFTFILHYKNLSENNICIYTFIKI